MFWRLGFLTAWRNLTRSILAILSMALAAGFLTYAISLSRGYPALYRANYRSLLGGEISIYSMPLSISTEEEVAWRFNEMYGVTNTDLLNLMPELKHGYLSNGQGAKAFTQADIETLASEPSIKGIYPRLQMPAFTSNSSSLRHTPLRGRISAMDRLQAINPASLVTAGRWFSEEDDGKMVAVVAAHQHYAPEESAAAVGDKLRVMVPRINVDNGVLNCDYSQPLLLELRIIGIMDIPTRYIPRDPVKHKPLEEGNKIYDYQIWLHALFDEIQIPQETWEMIWQRASADTYPLLQVALVSEELSYLEDTVDRLRLRFPSFSIFGIAELMQKAENAFLLEDPKIFTVPDAPRYEIQLREEQNQTILATDMRLPIIALVFINAALMIAANLLIMVNERRTEIGILKAVGSTRIQIVQMILSEAILISSVGALAGFLCLRIPALLNQLTNGVAFSQLIASLFRDMLLVLGIACLASILFALLPGLKTASLSVQEAVQSE